MGWFFLFKQPNNPRDPFTLLIAMHCNRCKGHSHYQLFDTDSFHSSTIKISHLSFELQWTCSSVPTGALKGIQKRNITMTTSPTWLLLSRKTTFTFAVHTLIDCHHSHDKPSNLPHHTTPKLNRWSETSGSWQLREPVPQRPYWAVSETNAQL